MGRWEPNARGRLEEAALGLYSERGFDRTTVAEIAQAAGLTERTFFRHFADKREVLFGGTAELHDLLNRAVADAPAKATPLDAAAAGLDELGVLLQERRGAARARQRQRIIAANTELQERELIKLASLASTIATALHERGVDQPLADLTGQVAIAVFRTAFERWVDESNRHDLPTLIHESLDQLATVTTSR
jgi:AcrR family transcriptional regulator